MKPKVSIIVVNFNGVKFLKDCFNSLFNLNYPKSKLEIIMVDNGSTDNSIEFVRNNFPKVKILKNDVNNYCRANNLGINRAKGEYIAFLNNDTKVEKDWLSELVKIISEDNRIGAVGGKTLYPDGKISNVGHYELPNFYWGEKGAQEEKDRYEEIGKRPSLCGVAVLYPKKVFDNLGLFDEDFIVYMEDVDMSYRLIKADYTLVYAPKAIIYHYFHGTGDHELSRFYIERNRLLFIAKHYPHMLKGSLLGSGYFTAQKDISSTGKIYTIIPDVVIKLIKEHSINFTKEILKELFDELKKIANFENDLLVKKIQEQIFGLAEKEEHILRNQEEIKNLQGKLSLEKQAVIQREIEIKEKGNLISNINAEIKKVYDEVNFKNRLLLQKDEESTRKDEQLKRKDEEIRQRDGGIRQQEESLTQIKNELALKEQLMVQKTNEAKEHAEHLNQITREQTSLKEKYELLSTELKNKEEEINILKGSNIKLSDDLLSVRNELNVRNKELTRLSLELKKILESEGFRFILWPIWQFIAFIRKLITGLFKIIIFVIISPSFIFLPVLFFFEEKLWHIFSSLKKKCLKRDIVPFDKLKISIVIPHYNRLDLLNECLSSIFALDEFKNQDNEVLVVDDASNDNSIEFIKSHFPSVRVIRNRINRGFGFSCNRGVKEAKNELILLLNNDCLVTKDFLAPLIRHFHDEKVFAVTPKIYSWDKETFEWGMEMGGFENGYIRFWNEKETGHGDKICHTAPTSFVIGAAMLFRKKDFLWLGGFDSLYQPYCWEDIDISYRAWKRGLKVLYEPESIVYHKWKATIGKYKNSLERKNEIIFIWKNITGFSMLALHFMRLPFKVYANEMPFLVGFLWAFRLLPFVLLGRIKERKYAVVPDKQIVRETVLYYKNFEKREFKNQEPERKTVLMLTPFLPYKPKHGAPTVFLNRLKSFYEKYDIILLTFLENKEQFDYLPALKLYCKDIVAFLRVPDRVSFSQRLLYPEPIRKRYSNIQFKNKMSEIIKKLPIDLVLIETSFMIQYADYIKGLPIILEEHDTSILSLRKSFERRINNGFLHNLFNWARNRLYLAWLYSKFDKIVVFTEADAGLLRKINPHLDIAIIPPSIDLEPFKMKEKHRKDIDILFVGHFAHYPNIDGMKFFFKHIHPILKREMSRFVFKIIGSGIKKEEFMSLFKIVPEDKNIEFIGEVEEKNEVIEHLFRAKVFIAPIRIGGGVKIKILEAMAAGLPVVTTPSAIKGLLVKNGQDLLSIPKPLEMVRHIKHLLEDNEFALSISKRAQKAIESNYDNKKIGHIYCGYLEELTVSRYNAGMVKSGSEIDYPLADTRYKNIDTAIVRLACWELLNKCNYRCPYCFSQGKWEEYALNDFRYPDSEWLRFWQKIYAEFGQIHIIVTGGEPFVYPNFSRLIQELSGLHTIGILTNLSWDIKEHIKYLKPHRIRLHPSFHPFTASVDEFIGKMDIIKDYGWHEGVVIVAYPPLLDKLELFKHKFESSNYGCWINPYIGTYNNVTYPSGYTEAERKHLFAISCNIEFIEYQLSKTQPKGRLCNTGKTYFRMHTNGDISRCASYGHPIGHITDSEIKLRSEALPCESTFCMCAYEQLYLEGNEEKIQDFITSSLPRDNAIV
jgi:GT2 family glycosyltransferase/glycosyltransferase involved in cell wall biosynthesis